MTYILIIIPVILLIGLMWLFASYLPKRDLRLGKTKKIDAQNELPTTKIETEKQPISESIKMMEKKSKTDLKTNLVILLVLAVYLLLTFDVNRMEPLQANLGTAQVNLSGLWESIIEVQCICLSLIHI